MPIPPWSMVEETLKTFLGPAFLAALAVMLLIRLAGGKRAGSLASALALAAGILVGNHLHPLMRLQPERSVSEQPILAQDWLSVLGWSLEGKPPADPEQDPASASDLRIPPARFWIPFVGLLALLAEWLGGLSPETRGGLWAARMFVSVLASRLLTPEAIRLATPWAPWALAAVLFLEWTVLATLAQLWESSSVPAGLIPCLLGAGLVSLYAHSAVLAEIGFLTAFSLSAITLIAMFLETDTTPALAGAAVFLPALLLNTYHESFSAVPISTYALAACAPLALLLIMPVEYKFEGWQRWVVTLAVPLLPVAIAIMLAAQVEQIDFE